MSWDRNTKCYSRRETEAQVLRTAWWRTRQLNWSLNGSRIWNVEVREGAVTNERSKGTQLGKCSLRVGKSKCLVWAKGRTDWKEWRILRPEMLTSFRSWRPPRSCPEESAVILKPGEIFSRFSSRGGTIIAVFQEDEMATVRWKVVECREGSRNEVLSN